MGQGHRHRPDEARRLGRKLLAIAYVLMLGTNLSFTSSCRSFFRVCMA